MLTELQGKELETPDQRKKRFITRLMRQEIQRNLGESFRHHMTPEERKREARRKTRIC